MIKFLQQVIKALLVVLKRGFIKVAGIGVNPIAKSSVSVGLVKGKAPLSIGLRIGKAIISVPGRLKAVAAFIVKFIRQHGNKINLALIGLMLADIVRNFANLFDDGSPDDVLKGIDGLSDNEIDILLGKKSDDSGLEVKVNNDGCACELWDLNGSGEVSVHEYEVCNDIRNIVTNSYDGIRILKLLWYMEAYDLTASDIARLCDLEVDFESRKKCHIY